MAGRQARNREYLPEERLFLALEWEKKNLSGRTFGMIVTLFNQRFPGVHSPTKRGVRMMHQKLIVKYSTLDQRTGNSGRRKTVETSFNLQWMQAIMDFEMASTPGRNSAIFFFLECDIFVTNCDVFCHKF